MKIEQAALTFASLFICLNMAWAQNEKPNFTGTWKLDKEKSEMGTREGYGRFRGGMFDSLVIEHNEPTLIIKRKMNLPTAEERTVESKYTTDGKSNSNEGFRGMTSKSKTHWEEHKLITESTMETEMGIMEIKEVRSLSSDGKTMTVEVTTKGGRREGTRKLVFNKQEAGNRDTIAVVTQWREDQIVTEAIMDFGSKLTETYILAPGGFQIIVTLRVEDKRLKEPINIRHVYDLHGQN